MLATIVGLIFLTTFCAVVVVGLAVTGVQGSPRTELRRRLRLMAHQGTQALPPEVKSDILRQMTPADRMLSGMPFLSGLERKLDHAGLKMTITSFLTMTCTTALLTAAIVALATRTPWTALPAAAATLGGSSFFLRVLTQRRADRFTELFPEALTMIARSLRAGHSFNTAMQLVGTEIADPVGELFKAAYDQQMLGLRITDGLNGLNDRVESLDLRFFTTVISINSEIGGNLSEILEKLAETIRERIRIRKQVQVYTAQGRMSGYVLGALPIFAFIAFSILNPAYESALVKEPLGIYILAGALCMQLIGFAVIRNIIKIKI